MDLIYKMESIIKNNENVYCFDLNRNNGRVSLTILFELDEDDCLNELNRICENISTLSEIKSFKIDKWLCTADFELNEVGV